MRRVRRRQRRAGVTLFEVLIVIALIAILSGTVLFGSGMLGSTRVRAAATLLVSAARKAALQASSSGHPTRLVLDFDTRSINLEEATTSRMLRDKDAPAAGADPATEAEKTAKAEADRILDGPHAPKPTFTPVKGFSLSDTDTGQGRTLEKDVELTSVQTEHDSEPVTSGRAYVYFWPGGMTERAHVQLKRHGSSDGLTVSVSALTGRAKILHGLIDLPKPRSDDEEDQGEREEE